MNPSNTFSKKERLKSRKKLQQLFTARKHVFSGSIKLLYTADLGGATVQCGVGLSGRFFKKSVDRNRIKRLLREAYRLQQHDLKAYAQTHQQTIYVFILYTGKTIPAYEYVYKNVGITLQKLINTLHDTVENT